MLIIVDHRILQQAKEKLSEHGELLELQTEGITYPAISGHPDIFFCQGPDMLVMAPNLPVVLDGKHIRDDILDGKHIRDDILVRKLIRDDIPVIRGESPVGKKYPETARYNAVVTDKYIIHNFHLTDRMITRTFEDRITVHVDQGYCRCNLLALKDEHFITSDEGIFKVLRKHTENILKVTTNDIFLDGFKHGFFGGCCGIWDERVFITGSLNYFEDGKKVEKFLKDLGYEIVELYDGPLFDGGGIFFINV